jgi:hypothetical protein
MAFVAAAIGLVTLACGAPAGAWGVVNALCADEGAVPDAVTPVDAAASA